MAKITDVPSVDSNIPSKTSYIIAPLDVSHLVFISNLCLGPFIPS